MCYESCEFEFVTSVCVRLWNWIGSIAPSRGFSFSQSVFSDLLLFILSLVMARRPDLVQWPYGSNSLPFSSIQGLILHKLVTHPPAFIPTWHGKGIKKHQTFWTVLISTINWLSFATTYVSIQPSRAEKQPEQKQILHIKKVLKMPNVKNSNIANCVLLARKKRLLITE